jgi:diadenylate cyclase
MKLFILSSNLGILDKFNSVHELIKKLELNYINLIDLAVMLALLALLIVFSRKKMISSALVGMAVFYFATYVLSLLPLPWTSTFASAILSVGILAFVVLFHTEIRDLFEKIGSNPKIKIFNRSSSKSNSNLNYELIDNICSAVRELSMTKTGALIVIARTTQLDDVTSTGVKINADVNSYLLRNLFYDKSPLHDGAIVIDEGRISHAGCILPLTRRKDFEGDLGTRHKAAIGLSEISDAIIIVVSEETGIISAAMDYTLTRDFTSDTLRKFLLLNILNDFDVE